MLFDVIFWSKGKNIKFGINSPQLIYVYIYYSINNYTVSKERILNNSWVLPAQQASSSR